MVYRKEMKYSEHSDSELFLIVSKYDINSDDAIDAFEVLLSRYSEFINSICNSVIQDFNENEILKYRTLSNSIHQLFHYSGRIVKKTTLYSTKQIICWIISNEFARLISKTQINYFDEIENSSKAKFVKSNLKLSLVNSFINTLSEKELSFFRLYIILLRVSHYTANEIDFSNLAAQCLTTKLNFKATIRRIERKIQKHFKLKDKKMEDIILLDWDEPIITSGSVFPISKEEIEIFEQEVIRYQQKSKEMLDLLEVLENGYFGMKKSIPENLEIRIAARGDKRFLDDKLKIEILESLKQIKSERRNVV